MNSILLQNDETLFQTWRATLERLKNEKVEIVYNPNGPFQVMQPPGSTLVRYFTPAWPEAFDDYGQPK
jgi:hypothetical protein